MPLLARLKRLISAICPSNPRTGQIGSIDYNIWFAQLTGVPLLGFKHESLGLKGILLIYGIFMSVLVALSFTICEIWDLSLTLNNMDAFTQNSCLSFTHIAGFFKAINMHLYQQRLRAAVQKLKFIAKNYVRSEKQLQYFLRGEMENKIFLSVFAGLVGITGFIATILLGFTTAPVGITFPYRAKFPDWLPFPLKIFITGTALPMAALQIVSIDYLNVNLINQIRFQLNCLNLSFDELILDAKNEKTLVKKSNAKEMNHKMRDIVKHHCLVIEVRNEIEEIFRMPLLLQFLASLMIFGLTGFRATVSTQATITDSILYLYCGCILSELFIYCWFGNDVFEESKTLTDNGYRSTWYDFDTEFKQSLIIFLTGSQRPFLFTAGGFLSLSLPSFTGILSRSYTFIAVLRQIYGDD